MKGISYIVSGTYHVFDVACELQRQGLLEKVHLPADLARVIRWKKDVPLSKVEFSWWPPVKFGKIRRNGDEQRYATAIAGDDSSVVVGFPSFSEQAFRQIGGKKLKILDIDHFNWDLETTKFLANQPFRSFNINHPLDPDKFLMQKSELEREFRLRGIDFKYDLESLRQRAVECELADFLLVPVSYVKESLQAAGYPAERIHLLRYGYDPEIFFPAANKAFANAAMYGGTISYRKGWPYLKSLLEACRECDFDFYIAGNIEENLRSEVRQFFASCPPHIKYLGPLKQQKLAFYMRNVGAFVFPSVLEGFGMTVLQAMASGTPVVTTRATCGIDLITNQENGFVLPKENTSEWLEAIKSVVLQKRTSLQMGVAARHKVAQLTWSAYVSQLSSIITEAGQSCLAA